MNLGLFPSDQNSPLHSILSHRDMVFPLFDCQDNLTNLSPFFHKTMGFPNLAEIKLFGNDGFQHTTGQPFTDKCLGSCQFPIIIRNFEQFITAQGKMFPPADS